MRAAALDGISVYSIGLTMESIDMVNDIVAETDGLKYSKTGMVNIATSLGNMVCSSNDKGMYSTNLVLFINDD